MENKEKEVWVEKSRIYLGDDNIIFNIAHGGSDEKLALAVKKAILDLASLIEGRAKLYVDLSKAGKPSQKARQVYRSLAEHEKIGKVAITGLNPVARVLGAFIIGITRKKDIRFIRRKEEALAWLKEEAG